MVHESMRNLELDKRLTGRRGWISPQDLEKALEALPDASEKVAPPEERAGEAPGAGSQGEATPSE